MPETLPSLWPENVMPEIALPGDEIHVGLLTPLRFKSNGHLNDVLTFDQLIRLALRRCASLNLAFGSGEPDLDYKGMVEKARTVQTIASKLKWHDGSRYSNRQKQKVPFGGLLGEIHYTGDLGPFLPLLQFSESVHIGKNTSFGLGQIRCA